MVAVYEDHGISGAKGRDTRPQFHLMQQGAVRRRFDVVMAWTVDRLGRSLPDLIACMQEIHSAKVGLVPLPASDRHDRTARQGDVRMLGVFAEFERSMIQAHVNAGLARAKAAGVTLGRPKVSKSVEAAIRARLVAGQGMLRVAKVEGCGVSTVQRVKASMAPTA